MNIFARELADLLAEHGKELGYLYGLRSEMHAIYPHKVTLLKRSLVKNKTATLNADDLALLAEKLKLDPNGQEMLRLRAALIAEAVRHLLGGRMNIEVANELGEATFQLLLGQDPGIFFRQRTDLLSNMRGGLDDEQEHFLWPQDFGNTLRGGVLAEEDEDMAPFVLSAGASNKDAQESEEIEPALEEAVETYEQGALWLEVARDTRDPSVRQGYLAVAHTFLSRAKTLVINASTGRDGSSQQQEWLSLIQAALREEALLQQETSSVTLTELSKEV